MKKQFCIRLTILFVVLLSPFATLGQTTAFTYQGRLIDGASTPTGQYDLQFNLYLTATGGSPLNAAPIVLDNIQVTNGIFTVPLDFGNLFDGSSRFLEIGGRL